MKDVEKRNEDTMVESTRGYHYFVPDVDIIEKEDSYDLIFDVPGIDKDEISIKVEKDVLTVVAESTKEPVEGYDQISGEFDFCGYKRSFNLNGIVDVDKVDANYDNGTLQLTMPKREEQKTKEIPISIS